MKSSVTSGGTPGASKPFGVVRSHVGRVRHFWFTFAEAGELLGESERQISALVDSDQLDALLLGGRWVIAEEAIAALKKRRGE